MYGGVCWWCHTYFVFNGGLLVLVQVHLNQLRAIQLDADALANDFSWEDQIFQDGIVDSGQSAGTWTLLLQWISSLTGGLGQNLTFANNNDMFTREFLLQFTNQNDLDLLENLLLGNGNIDDDSLKV